MKPDFLDELEKQLVEATERRKRRRLRRPWLWLGRSIAGRSAMSRSVTTGAGGAVVVIATAAVVMLVVIPAATTAGHRRARDERHRAEVKAASAGQAEALASLSSGRYGADGGTAIYASAASAAVTAGSHTTTTAGMASIETQGAVGTAGQVLGPRTPVPTGTVPAHFQPQSFTAISEISWWLLGRVPCASGSCLEIARTTDGGRSFVSIPAPPTKAVRGLRFGGSEVGYAYGRQLWSTHNGGLKWTRVNVGGRIDELATNGSYVFAIVHNQGHSWLTRSPVGLDDWEKVKVSAGEPFTGLWVQGNEVFVETRHAGRRPGKEMAISTDNGFHFTHYIRGPRATACLADAALPAIWDDCQDGRHVQFAAANAHTAVLGVGQLYRTTDGGHRYHRVPTPRGLDYWQYLGFTDSTHGVALGRFGKHGRQERLYYTTDGGRSYHYVPIGA